ncbi:hypothetical protein [Streptomyces sp. NPDC046860]|uniref:hypothetical protein n=1 Tax=Streptomyces sp. NPDC046860 TaxID=3154495 RepID=UPI0033EF04DF
MSVDEFLFSELIHLRRQQPVLLAGPLPPSLGRRLDMTGTRASFDAQATVQGALASLRPG